MQVCMRLVCMGVVVDKTLFIQSIQNWDIVCYPLFVILVQEEIEQHFNAGGLIVPPSRQA